MDLHKDPTLPPPADTHKWLCVPKNVCLLNFCFRHKNKRYTSPLPLIARLRKGKESTPSRAETHPSCTNSRPNRKKKICQRPIIILSICFASIGAEKSKKKKRLSFVCQNGGCYSPPRLKKVATGSAIYDNKPMEFRNVVAAA